MKMPELPTTGQGAEAVCRNWKVYDLLNEGDRYSVLIHVDGTPTNTHETVQDYAPYEQTAEGEVFDYLTDQERRILRRGVVKRGDAYFDKNPATGGAREFKRGGPAS